MYTHITHGSIKGYLSLTSEVIKGHWMSNCDHALRSCLEVNGGKWMSMTSYDTLKQLDYMSFTSKVIRGHWRSRTEN